MISRRIPGRAAFSLVELLAVMAAVGMLVALMLPALSRSRAAARRALCANNLHQLHVAYVSRKADHQGRQAISHPPRWVEELAEYTGGDREVFFCPEHDREPVYWNGQDPSADGWSGIAAGDVPGVSWKWGGATVPLTNAHIRGEVLPWSHPSGGDKWRKKYTSKPKQALVLGFRDGDPGAGMDAWANDDPSEHPVTFVPVDGPDGSQYVEVITWKNDAYWGVKRLFYFDQEVTEPVPGFKKWTRIVTAPGASESSYGINNAVRDFQGDASILLVDYNKIVANVVQPEGTDLWASMSAPRHTGRINTLTGDGRVIAHTRETIDPSIPAVHDGLWLPHLRAARQGGQDP